VEVDLIAEFAREGEEGEGCARWVGPGCYDWPYWGGVWPVGIDEDSVRC